MTADDSGFGRRPHKRVLGDGMRFLRDDERMVAAAVAALADGNRFLPERVERKRQALGPAFSS